MFAKHVSDRLSAYCHRELALDEAARVAGHLMDCSRCREELKEIRRGIDLARALPLVPAPSSLWNGIVAAASERPRPRSASPRLRFAFAGALAVAVIGAGFALLRTGSPLNAWEVIRLEGLPRAASAAIEATRRIGVGDWIETDSSSRARINVGMIGEVDLEPNTRVRLLETRLRDHRLALDRGKMHARIWAPPRLFFVETPSALAIDLGCAYTLEVGPSGDGLLRVTAGWVGLERDGRESRVPSGAACRMRRGIGPGTPYFEDAPEQLRDALVRLDFEQAGDDALAVVLAFARKRDWLSLQHLLARVKDDARQRVYEKMVELAPPPESVTAEQVLSLDQRALERWREKIDEDLW